MADNSSHSRPLVGLLYNPAIPYLIDQVGELIQHISVIPERNWFDLGPDVDRSRRFRMLPDEIAAFKGCIDRRVVAGHGVGLSLPSAMPIDQVLLDQIATVSDDLGFAWYSEHLSMFLTPHGAVPNAQAALGLPVVYDEETFEILAGKLETMRNTLGCPVILENGSIFTTIPEMEMSEPEFFNRLYREADCGMLLDLHNLYVTARHGNVDPDKYLKELDLDGVLEIHMAGGDSLGKFYTDSHSQLTPADVWSLAHEFVPHLTNLRAITFEFHESYFERLGVLGIARELERMHELASYCDRRVNAIYA